MNSTFLSDIPWRDSLLLRVIGVTGKLGTVVAIEHESRYNIDDPDGDFTTIAWDDGTQSMQRHYNMSLVKVIYE